MQQSITAPSALDPPAVTAFDAVAPIFDERFGSWSSVAAQRRAVRRHLLQRFPRGSQVLELGGGTGEDALFLAGQGRRVLVTDGSANMVQIVRQKAQAAGLSRGIETRRVVLEELEEFAREGHSFDGAFSNFAALNCMADLSPCARGLAHMLPAGAHALLVVFGPCCPGEIVVQLTRGDRQAAFRRLAGGAVPARLGGRNFTVQYPTPAAIARMFAPWFRIVRTRGIGVFVPPSAAEPMISRYPRLLRALEGLDRLAAAPLAWLGDHVLLDFERSTEPAPAV